MQATAATSVRPIAVAQVQEREDLWRAHHQECEGHLGMAPNPDWLRYQALHQSDALIALGAFDGETLVGYVLAIVAPSLTYSETLCCEVTAVYVHPDSRKHGHFMGLLGTLKREAERRGCDWLFMHAKVGSRLATLLPDLDFKAEEVVYRRMLRCR